MDFKALLRWRNHEAGFAYHNGIKITKIAPGTAEGEIALTADHLNQAGVVHGGCQFALMDTVGGAAAMSYGNVVSTANSSVQFLRAAEGTGTLRAVATEIKAGRTLLVYEVEVFDATQRLVSKASMTFFRLDKPLELEI